MKFVFVSLIASLLSASAFAGDVYCKDNGSATLIASKDKIEITSKGLGESDGTLTFTELRPRAMNPDEVEMYSEYLTIPLESGKVTFATLVYAGGKAKAQIYEVTTKVDLRGKVNKALMVSLAGSPPTLLGIDNLCK